MAARLTIYCGPMWAAKSHLLLMELGKLRAAGARAVTIKPRIDTRAGGAIASRTGLRTPADYLATDLAQVTVDDGVVYALDEAQFFDRSLLTFWERVRGTRSSRMLVAALDLDYARKPFGHVLELAKTALQTDVPVVIHRLAAECAWRGAGEPAPCGCPAPYTQRLVAGGTDTVRIGNGEFYRPACPAHHQCEPADTAAWGHTPVERLPPLA